VEYRPLGNTDLKVSALCLGTMTFGEQNSKTDAHQQLDRAFEHGVNFIDTAEMYAIPPRAETQGLTESHIGSWIAGTRIPRDQIILATKVAGPSESMRYLRGGPRLNAAHITQAVEDSLQRLRTDYIDLYQVHWPERSSNYFGSLGYRHVEEPETIPIEETYEALVDLIEAGKVRHLGVSNETPWGMLEYLRIAQTQGQPRIISIQNPYNLLNRSFEVGLAEIAIRERCPLLAYSPLAFGRLTGKYPDAAEAGARLNRWPEWFTRYNSQQVLDATDRYVALAQQLELSPATLALAFVRQQAFVGSVIIGATTLAQLDEDLDSASVVLPDAALQEIDAIHETLPNPAP